MYSYLFALFLLLSASCSWTNKVDFRSRILTNAGRMVKITNRLPPISCVEVDELYAQTIGNPIEMQRIVKTTRILMRNKAAQKKANFVMIETSHTSMAGKEAVVAFSGTAYRCMLAKKAKNMKESMQILEEAMEDEDLESIDVDDLAEEDEDEEDEEDFAEI